MLQRDMPTSVCPEDNCENTHEFTASELGDSFTCDCGAILRIGRSNNGDLKLVHHPLNDIDD